MIRYFCDGILNGEMTPDEADKKQQSTRKYFRI